SCWVCQVLPHASLTVAVRRAGTRRIAALLVVLAEAPRRHAHPVVVAVRAAGISAAAERARTVQPAIAVDHALRATQLLAAAPAVVTPPDCAGRATGTIELSGHKFLLACRLRQAIVSMVRSAKLPGRPGRCGRDVVGPFASPSVTPAATAPRDSARTDFLPAV